MLTNAIGEFVLCGISDIYYRVIFFTASALKVLSVGDGKIPTKKVKVKVSYRENRKF